MFRCGWMRGSVQHESRFLKAQHEQRLPTHPSFATPTISVLRRGTTVLVVLGEWHLLGKRSTSQQLMCLALMVGGAVVAGATDLTFSAPGYAWVGVCVAATAAYLLLIRLLRDTSGLGQHTMLLYNNVLSLPLMLVALAGAPGELREVWRYERLRDPEFLAFFFVACSQAFVLNLCIFRCTLLNSPLATNVTGQVKDILTTTLGVLLFADVRLTRFNLGGLCVGLLGSLLYSLESYKAARNAPAKAAS
ncbi:hypothetical protein H632_c408p1 [Helicosporidium sp. ATCC 50920]|nr:hypothetical protein H632_c408p1 [Helicosporidium sp. ATCC 50920]|eukprot:KDD75983.1 hypothetical protein H632_c408p1 [Helicosporidium sp. ATCC 50920]